MNEHEAPPVYAACPRCVMEYHPDLPAMSRNALGRDIPICATCGMAEAVRDLAKQPPIPYNEWPVDPDELGREYAATARWRQPGQPLDTIPESWEERS